MNKVGIRSIGVVLIVFWCLLEGVFAQDADPAPLLVRIPSGVNVRDLATGNPVSITGDVALIGWFDPAGSAFAQRASTLWLVVTSANGRLTGAVNIDLVTQSDGTSITPEELATVTNYSMVEGVPTLILEPVIVTIPAGTLARDIRQGRVGQLVQAFNLVGEQPLLAYFDATDSSTFFEVMSDSLLWGIVDFNGISLAISLGDVLQADGTELTEAELRDAQVVRYEYDPGTRSFGPPFDVLANLPESITIEVMDYDEAIPGFIFYERTVTLQPDKIYPIPFGLLPAEDYPDLWAYGDLMGRMIRIGQRNDMQNMYSIPYHMIYAGGTIYRDFNLGHHAIFALPRRDGTWAGLHSSATSPSTLGVLHLTPDLELADVDALTNVISVQPLIHMGENSMLGHITAGESVIVFLFASRDPRTGEARDGVNTRALLNRCGNRHTDQVIEHLLRTTSHFCNTTRNEPMLPSILFTALGVIENQ